MSAGIKRGTGKDAGKHAGRTPSKRAKRERQKRKAAESQILREGTPAAIATRLADRERNGDIRKGPEEVGVQIDDLIGDDCFDSEIATSDVDDSSLPDLDESPGEWAGGVAALHPGASFISEDSAESRPDMLELRVDVDGTCRFLRPGWMAGEALTDDGEEDFERIENRFQMFDDIAAWLTRERTDFLRDPNPSHLGVRALEEIKQGKPSVSPQAFLELSGIKERATANLKIEGKSVESDFSRYCTACGLVWEDGSRLPLRFIFGTEARNAWVACAVRQFFESIGQPLETPEQIAKLRGLTVPKNPKDKDRLAESSITSLTQPEFVARANQMVGTRWAEVMDFHFQPLPTL